jgi:hypothetical protein
MLELVVPRESTLRTWCCASVKSWAACAIQSLLLRLKAKLASLTSLPNLSQDFQHRCAGEYDLEHPKLQAASQQRSNAGIRSSAQVLPLPTLPCVPSVSV